MPTTAMRVLTEFPGPDAIVVFRVEGTLAKSSSRRLRRHLRRLGRRYPIVCLDLRGLAALELEAAHTIAQAEARAAARGRRLAAIGAPPDLAGVLTAARARFEARETEPSERPLAHRPVDVLTITGGIVGSSPERD